MTPKPKQVGWVWSVLGTVALVLACKLVERLRRRATA